MNPEILTLFNEQPDLALYAMYTSLIIGVFLITLVGIQNNFPFRRFIMASLFIGCLGIGYVSLNELFGRPKPVGLMVWNRPDVDTAEIIASHVIENEAIYMLLLYKGIDVPRYYQYPWDKEMAEKLQRSKRAVDLGEIPGVELKNPFQHSWEERIHPEIHEMPWPKMPDKDDPDEKEIIDLDKMV